MGCDIDSFDIAKRATKKSNPSVTKYRHASVILDKKGRIIAVGRNHWAGHTLEIDEGGTINKTVHSEIDALRRVNIRRLSGATIINYARTRVSSNEARPCVNCWPLLKKLGFTKVFYSIRSDLSKPVWVEEKF